MSEPVERRMYGVVPAIVTSILDPDRRGRVEIKLPWFGDDGPRLWARLLTPYADDDQGIQVMPEVDTEVAVAFAHGDMRFPYVLGACWNGVEAPPETPTASNDKRVWKTRSGSRLEFDDRAGAAKVTLSMQSGHEVVLDDAAREVRIAHGGGASIVIDASGKISVTATSTVDVTASTLNVHAPVATFDGMINCTTLIASAGVVSPSYTPGAGNVW